MACVYRDNGGGSVRERAIRHDKDMAAFHIGEKKVRLDLVSRQEQGHPLQ